MTGSSFRDMISGHRRTIAPGVSPVLVIGMHRSGTTIISECLEACGWFAGARKDPNNESLYFLGLNDWILQQAGCRWDTPELLAGLLDQTVWADKVTDQLRHMMTVPGTADYLGRKPSRGSGGLLEMNRCWGWKDPRTTLTLPFWRKVFPDAKVVHVSRHGVDVAASLVQRSRLELDKWRRKLRLSAAALVTDSPRCLTLEGAFGLWKSYQQAAERHTACLGDRLHRLRYEDFLADPQTVAGSMLTFCGLEMTADYARKLDGQLKTERALAYRGDASLREFASGVADELHAYGYGA